MSLWLILPNSTKKYTKVAPRKSRPLATNFHYPTGEANWSMETKFKFQQNANKKPKPSRCSKWIKVSTKNQWKSSNCMIWRKRNEKSKWRCQPTSHHKNKAVLEHYGKSGRYWSWNKFCRTKARKCTFKIDRERSSIVLICGSLSILEIWSPIDPKLSALTVASKQSTLSTYKTLSDYFLFSLPSKHK